MLTSLSLGCRDCSADALDECGKDSTLPLSVDSFVDTTFNTVCFLSRKTFSRLPPEPLNTVDD
jgi:hypothetical protein